MNITGLFINKNNEFQDIVPTKITRTLYSRKAVRDALRREHARAERSGRSFCCVTFALHSADVSARSFQRLFNVLDQRCRSTDEIGWFDNSSLCAILPDTDEPGAQGFAADVVGLAHQQGLSPSVTIYSYETTATPPSGRSPDRVPDLSRRPDAKAGVPLDACPAFRWQRYPHQGFTVLGVETLSRVPLPFWKRTIDICGASLALLMFLPLMVIIAFIIKCCEPKSPVFFKQRRAGLGGQPFTIIKFRTMCMDAEARKEQLRAMSEQDGPAFKMSADPRVTPIGRFLRKTSLDELPQLINVLSGNMSLVGPRPPTLDEVAKYKPWYRRRLAVTPGITCVWQVEGRSSVTFEQWMRMDARYVRQSSLWGDLKLIVRTVPAVLLQRGAC
jgi:lipopolysaccharide/colanic/teichoic acid biosynthesis glycosyltransferase